ncbi:MAG TPA: ABC transporter substrate-binding protein [Kineosporiaceae bacterium]
MRPPRSSAVAVTTLVVPLMLVACSSSPAPARGSETSAGKPYIPIITKGLSQQFWQAVKQGAEKAATDLGVKITFEGPENESQVDRQVDMLQTALTKNPQAICFAALDSKAVTPLLQQAQSKKIPIIAFDSGVDGDIPVATVATDNAVAAAAAADKMAAAIGDVGDVALVVHDQTSRTGISRRDGFVQETKAKHPGITIVDIQYGSGDVLKSDDLTKAIIKAHPNLKGIFAANEGSANGVLNAVKETGTAGKITVIGYDAGRQQKEAVRSGVELGAISQDPVNIGYRCIETAAKVVKGQPVQKTIDTGFKWYDRTNVDSADLKPLLYD